MNSMLFNVGVFIPNKDRLDDAIEFIDNKILKNNEIIEKRIKCGVRLYEVVTNKNSYIVRIPSDNVRCDRYSEIFIFEGIEKELIECVIFASICNPNIIDGKKLRRKDRIHYLK